MFNIASTSTLLLAAVSTVSGFAVVRRTAHPGYNTGYLENYDTYHTRYLALNCQSQHNTPFFDKCCHPLLATEKLETARPAECIPTASAASSASAAEPTSTVTTPADNGDDEYEDCDEDEGATSAAPQPNAAAASTPAPATQASTPAPAANDDDDLEDCEDEDPTTAAGAAPAAASPAASPAPTPAPAAPSAAAPAPSAAPSSASSPAPAPSANTSPAPTTGGDLVTGGHGTFFFQNGNPGACGDVHADSDLVVAMDCRTYQCTGQRSSLCGKQVQITNTDNGKTVVATIADACPTCDNEQSIDMSTGAYDAIADRATGVVPIAWKLL